MIEVRLRDDENRDVGVIHVKHLTDFILYKGKFYNGGMWIRGIDYVVYHELALDNPLLQEVVDGG